MEGFILDFFFLLAISRTIYGFNTTEATIINNGHITCDPVQGRPRQCACRASTSKRVIDLSALDPATSTTVANKPRFYAEGKPEGPTLGWYIAWSPCNDFDMFTNVSNPRPGERACRNTGFALFTNVSVRQCTPFGSHAKSFFKAYGTDENYDIKLRMVFSYFDKESGQKNRAFILLKCADTDGDVPKLTFNERNENSVYATFTASCCCEGKCYKPPKPKGSNKDWGIIGGGISAGVIVIAGAIILLRRRRVCCQEGPLPYPVPVEFNQEEQNGDNERRPLLGA